MAENDQERDDTTDQSDEMEKVVEQESDDQPIVEDESDDSDESDESGDSNESDDSKDDIDWKERALKAEKLIEKNKKKAKEAPKPEVKKDSNDLDRLRLETRGVMEKEDQDYVMKFAKGDGISPVDALADEVVKDKLAHFAKLRTQKAASSAPSGRTQAGGGDNVDALVRRYKKDGTLPDNPRLVSKILDKLSQE